MESGGKLTIQSTGLSGLDDFKSQDKMTSEHRPDKKMKKEKPRRRPEVANISRPGYEGNSQGLGSEYLTPVPSIHRDESVRYHMDPTHQYGSPPSYRTNPGSEMEYSPGSPPPSYTSHTAESQYTRLTHSLPPQNTERTNVQGYANNAYEELPDIRTHTPK